MKRKWLWLALPLVLCALIFGAKWHAEHPTPTPEDLAFREAFSRPSQVTLTSMLPRMHPANKSLPREKFKRYVDNFYILPFEYDLSVIDSNPVAEVNFVSNQPNPQHKDVAILSIRDGHKGFIIGFVHNKTVRYQLHPVTVERWTQFLNADLGVR